MWEIVGISSRKGIDVLATGLTESDAIDKMKTIKKKPYEDGYWDVGYYESIMRIESS